MSTQFLHQTHICAADGMSRFSNPEGRCKACKPFYTVFEHILLQVGGVDGFSRGITEIIEARKAGRRGDSVRGRVTRTVLNAILQSDHTKQLIRIYQEFLKAWDISLKPQVEGMGVVWYHDYTYHQPEAKPVVDTGWRMRWESRRAAKREERAAVRQGQTIILRWEKAGEVGQFKVGANDEAGRKLAAEAQTRGQAQGYSVSFTLA